MRTIFSVSGVDMVFSIVVPRSIDNRIFFNTPRIVFFKQQSLTWFNINVICVLHV